MSNYLWKFLPETSAFIKAVNKEIELITEELTDFRLLLNTSDQVMREYYGNLGILEGLRRVKECYEEIKDEQQSEAISWQDED